MSAGGPSATPRRVPELPEVELTRRNLVRWLRGREVARAEADPGRIFRGADASAFERLRGPLVNAGRRGKYLMLEFGDGAGVLAHLGMTGKFVRRAQGEPARFSRARLVLDDGMVIHYADPRLFGRIEPHPAQSLRQMPVIAALGVDPLEDGLTWKQLAEAVAPSRQALKVALMDQGRIAGLGNIHAAEALYRAGLHPARAPGSLSDAEWKALARGIDRALKFALEQEEGEELEYVEEPGAENPFLIYGRQGEPCRKCKASIQSFVQGGRTTHFCPKCQPKRGKR